MSESFENMNRIIIQLTGELLESMKTTVFDRLLPCEDSCEGCGPEERATCRVRLLRISRVLADLIQMNKPLIQMSKLTPPVETKPEKPPVFADAYKAGDTCPHCQNGTVEPIPGTDMMRTVLQCTHCHYLFPDLFAPEGHPDHENHL